MNKLISLNKLSSKTKYTGQNCFGLTLYYAKIKPAKEPQLYFCLFNFMAVKHARPLLELAPNSQLSYKMFLSEICFNLPIISISAFYIVVFKESLFQAKEKENSPYGLKKIRKHIFLPRLRPTVLEWMTNGIESKPVLAEAKISDRNAPKKMERHSSR